MSSVKESVFRTVKRYRNNRYDFAIDDDLKCEFCWSILFNPVRASCGCRYCKECIDSLLNEQSKNCVNEDCEEIETLTPDNSINLEIGNLKVKCIYDGCIHEDLLKKIEGHLKICQYQTVVCGRCSKDCVKLNFNDHIKNVCSKRTVKCTNCEKSTDFTIYIEEHLDINNEQLDNRYKCQLKRNERPPKFIQCSLGCHEKVMEDNFESHLVEHFEYFLHKLHKLRNEKVILENQLEDSLDKIELLKSEMARLKLEKH